MKFTDRLNARLHPFFARRVRQYYRNEIRGWEKQHPESFGEVPTELKKKYEALWSRLIPNPYDGWLRLLTNLSGKLDYRFMPADVYYTVIERCLNDCNAFGGIADKNTMSIYVPHKYLPFVVLRYVRGIFFDNDMRVIPPKKVNDIIRDYPYDVVGKIASDSCGGAGVRLFRASKSGQKFSDGIELTAEWLLENTTSYLVQERVRQEPVASSFNPNSVNTCRIVTFRRPWSGLMSVNAAMFRMGQGSGITDNSTGGGVCVDVSKEGVLADVGVDNCFGRMVEHPQTHRVFSGVKIPFFEIMCSVAIEIASRVLDHNILGFDIVAREDGRPCILEVNDVSLASIMIQMGRPLFGDETELLVDWCRENRRFDSFKHFRTWY